jgi:alpha-galactosidase
MKFGLLMGSGEKTCQGNIGSLGHEDRDAIKISEWGVEYLKYDSCYAGVSSAESRFTAMSKALNESRTGGYGFVHYDIDNWGNEQVTKWAPGIADSWTTSVPIGASNQPANAWT